MNIYKITNPDPTYGQYCSAVVIAGSAEAAARIHPDGSEWPHWEDRPQQWVDVPDMVDVEHIGTALPGDNTPRVILTWYLGE